jgi:hypothetical protein
MAKKWIYLIEKIVHGRFEPVAICTSLDKAHQFINMIAKDKYIISRLELNNDYPKGIGICKHWRIG